MPAAELPAHPNAAGIPRLLEDLGVVPPKFRWRQRVLRGLVGWGTSRLAELRTQIDRHRLVGLASTFFRDNYELVSPIARTHHLGVLAPLTSIQRDLTRLDYAVAIAGTLRELKDRGAGLGLGSKGDPDEVIVFRGKPISGLELTQTWAFLQNLGHLRGTIATERAVLFHLLTTRDGMRDLVGLVPDTLRPIATRVLQSRSMYRFAYVLSMVVLGGSKTPARDQLIQATLLMHTRGGSERLRRLRVVFNLARELTYLRFHAMFGLPGSVEAITDVEMAAILGHDDIAFEEHARVETSFRRMLRAIDEYQYARFFTSMPASFLVLEELANTKHWWTATTLGLAERIEWLRDNPVPRRAELPEQPRAFVRLQVPLSERHWVATAERWWSSGHPWSHGDNFLVTSRPGGDCLHLDIFGRNGRPSSAALHHVAREYAPHCTATWANEEPTADDVETWRSVARFGLATLTHLIADRGRGQLRPAEAAVGHGYASMSEDRIRLAERVLLFSSRCRDVQRGAELEAVGAYLRDRCSGDGVHLAFLGTTLLVDKNDVEVDELDGVIFEYHRSALVLHVLEFKGGKKGRGRKQQLNETLSFISPGTEHSIETLRIGRQKVAHGMLRFP